MSSKDKILITGAAGYIGRPLARNLAKQYSVIGIDRAVEPDDWPSNSGYIQCRLDVATPAQLAPCLEGVKTVFHLAAARADWGLTEQEYRRDNIIATQRLLEAGRKMSVPEWLYFSTVGVVGPSRTNIDESAPYSPSSVYGRTKAIAEKEFIDFGRLENRIIKIIRPSAVFSERQPCNTNIHRLIIAISKHRFVRVGKGQEIKTTSYLDNLLEAVIWLHKKKSGDKIQIYNYVDEPKLSTKEMVEIVSDELGISPPRLRIPLSLIIGPAYIADVLGGAMQIDLPVTAARIKKFCTATDFDGSKIRVEGFEPSFRSETALRRTVKFYQEKHLVE